MSALGQKQTYAVQIAMSALPPIATAKADIRKRSCLLYPQKRTCALAHVCFGPIADIPAPIRSPHRQEQAPTAVSSARWLSPSSNSARIDIVSALQMVS